MTAPTLATPPRPMRPRGQTLQQALERAGVVMFGLILLIAALGPLISPHDPAALLGMPHQPMSGAHLFGTDNLGRDIFSRVLAGARYTVVLAVGSTAVALMIGILLGAIAGYFGGLADLVISRFVEVVLVLPQLFLILLLVAYLGQTSWVILVVIGFTMWPTNARLMRAQVLSIRERTYVQASRLGGVGRLQVLARHIVPNSIAPVLASCSLQMADVVLIEAGLSYLGLGDLSKISWGRMIQEGQSGFQTSWWAVVFPGLALLLLCLSLHLIGDALSRRLNSRERR